MFLLVYGTSVTADKIIFLDCSSNQEDKSAITQVVSMLTPENFLLMSGIMCESSWVTFVFTEKNYMAFSTVSHYDSI